MKGQGPVDIWVIMSYSFIKLHYTRQMLLHMGASLSPFVAIIALSVTACNVNSGINVCML